jgi:hypothetical protein
VPKRRSVPALVWVVAGCLWLAACGGSSPTIPTGGGSGGGTSGGSGGGSQTPPANVPPVIDSFTVQGTRSAKEPANFADLGEAIAVSAKVHDDDTPAEQLEYQWSAAAGTFTGSGASVTWTAPSAATTPADVTITLKVVDHYGFPGQTPTFTQSVTRTTTLSLHDSAGEVGTMARQFLLDFSDSSISTDVVMRNFDMTCGPAQDERDQVANNRSGSHIEKSSIGSATTTVPFGNAFCPVPGRIQRGDACSAVPSHWESTDFSNRHYIIADGVDYVSAYYHADIKAWKLCDSQFPGTCFDATTGKACGAAAAATATPDSVRWRRIELPR